MRSVEYEIIVVANKNSVTAAKFGEREARRAPPFYQHTDFIIMLCSKMTMELTTKGSTETGQLYMWVDERG